MKIAFIGAQSGGKTSTLYYVMSELKLVRNDVAAIEEFARKCPYQINKAGDFRSQLWLLTQQMVAEADLTLKWKHVISDRSVIDPLMYFQYIYDHTLGDEKDAALNQKIVLRKIIEYWTLYFPYDAYFFFEPLPMHGDADRPNDEAYQKEINQNFEGYCWGKMPVYRVNQPNKVERRKYVLEKILELIANEESAEKS